MDEKDLVELARQGRPDAYEELVRKYQSKVFSMALNFTRNREEANDIAQEVFLKAYLALPKFNMKAEFGTWLYRISINHLKDFMRKKGRRREVPLDDVPELRAPADDPIAASEAARERESRRALVLANLGTLPDKYRVVLTLRDIQGMPYEQITEVLRVSPGTVDSRLHRARKLLRARITAGLEGQGGVT